MSALDVVLRSERLILRPLRAADAGALFAAYSDPAVVRYWSGAPWTEMARADAYVADGAREIAEGVAMRLGLEVAASGAFVGQVSLHRFDAQNRRCELGYALAGQYWGQGYMGEALQTLLDFGFDTLDLNRVEADIDPRNGASLRAVERMGFIREGLLRERWLVAGEVCDTALYGLLRSAWLARRATTPAPR
ncbi:GNAT family N-acetyltransferase [Massilia sp. DWR3-1-1]|uniref:GNAT family N-acetyltransferase n=1 Tax=Massilia sp. DWR3-1-1 TaxID=2804559 RepID=UPI003CEBA133